MVARTPPPLPKLVYCTASNRIIDLVRKAETEAQAVARLSDDYGPNLTVLPFDEAEARFEAQFKTDPVQITESEWWYALEVLPPEDWHHTAAGESFKMSERLAGSITGIYVALEEGHFMFNDSAQLPHADCVARVRDWLEQAPEDASDGPEV
jgi:hypothetical protein